MREYILKCGGNQAGEPIIQNVVGDRPWSKVGIDRRELQGCQLLVAGDYYSSYIEVRKLPSMTSSAVFKLLFEWFARHSIPDTVASDNSRQFDSVEFQQFARAWDFEYQTSSPYYAQSNGKSENAVKIMKQLFRKCGDTHQSK